LAFCQHLSNGARGRALLFTELPELHHGGCGNNGHGYPVTDSAVVISRAALLALSPGISRILLRPHAGFHDAGHPHSNVFRGLEPASIAQTPQVPVISAGKDREMKQAGILNLPI
jgi:hypothetical protein